jgi:hypothetical protein
MGHQTATTTCPYTPNERSSDSFRHTPTPREDETAVTGGFTARRTRIPGAACARQLRRRAVVVGQGGLQRRCRGAVRRAAQRGQRQCGEHFEHTARKGREEGMGRRPRRRGAHARRRGHARRGMSGDRGTGIPSYPARGSPRGCESIPPYRTLRCLHRGCAFTVKTPSQRRHDAARLRQARCRRS